MNIDLSICIIARNEEINLRQCLQALAPLQAEIVVVDTGSTDATTTVAAEYDARICSFPWIDDFSAARNFAAEQSVNDLILTVDCDEFLQDADIPSLEKCILGHADAIGMITRLNPYSTEKGDQLMHENVARLYDRRRFCWKGKIHENIAPISESTGIRYYEIPLVFYHVGYLHEDARKRKATRDLSMLQKELEEKGADPYICFQLGQSYKALGDKERAARYYDQGLSMDLDPRLTYVQDMIEAYGYVLLDLKQYDKALGLEAVYDLFAKRADFFFLMGLIYMNNARFENAIAEFTKATETSLYSVEGTNSYLARYNIGVIHEVLGNIDKAADNYRACGDYPAAVARLKAIS